jgi:predicted ATPase
MPPVRRPIRPARPRAGARVPPGRRAGRVTFGVLNFKSIAAAEIEPKRLTVVAGSNSSGKSSLLQSVLFAAQSFGEPTPVINGDLVRLGEASDVIRNGMDETTLEFCYRELLRHDDGEDTEEVPRAWRLTLTARDAGRSLAAHEFSLWRRGACMFKAAAEDQPKNLPRGEEELALRIVDPENFRLPENSYLIIAGITPTRLAYEADEQKLAAEFDLAVETGRTPRLPLEEILRLARVNSSDDAVSARLTDLIHRVSHGDLGPLPTPDRELLLDAFKEVVAPAGWISEPIAAPGRGRPFWRVRADESEGLTPTALAHDISRGVEQVERLSAAIIYLGPLRDDPRVAYPLGHTVRALPVGEKGEFTAAYLRENRGVRLSYGRPDGSQTFGTLASAVNQWCDYLGIAARIEVSTQGKLGHVLGLRVGGQERDPTAIGVGASQLLPVVVLVLGAPEGAVVLLEQPELHLHPGVQSRLADFLSRARRDIRIVVETHSEYLLTRLRLRIAEGDLDPDELAVLFATQKPDDEEADSEAVHTQFEHLALDELGDFNRWPEDFFDSLDRDSVDLARAVARKLELKSPPTD